MDHQTTPTIKRKLSLLAAKRCLQNIIKQEADLDSETPVMPKLNNASPRSSMCVETETSAKKRESEKSPCAISQLDKSLFEPIAFVTPPKKRAKSESAVSSFDFRPELHRMSSFQYQNNFNSRNTYGQYPVIFQSQASMYTQSTTNILSQYAMASRPYSALTFSNGGNFETGSLSAAEIANEITPLPTQKRRQSLIIDTTDANGLLEEFEPLFVDPSMPQARFIDSGDSDSTDRCPELCASSSSLSTATSSLLDDGNVIISTSDLFKENNYAKAEVEYINEIGADLSTKSSIQNRTKNNLKASPAPTVSTKKSTSNTSSQKDSPSRFKPFHEEKWNFHFGELLNFKKENGHCLVPHTFPSKPHLARWVKRQRRQYKLRQEGNKNSTMTVERIKILNDIGFVWDSHEVIWNERFTQLVAYKQRVGHCRVPSYCKECPQLASWVKCQRRQYKLFWEEGKGSSMNMDRIKLLNSIGFIWEVHPGRKKKESDPHYQHLANILMDA